MKIIAHRGYSGIAPENTIAAFAKAIEAGCKTIELDVQLTQDSVPFVIHDPTIDRTTNGRGKIIDIPSDELCVYSAAYEDKFGSDFIEERVPSLEDALEFLKGEAQVLIEIKEESVFPDRQDIEKGVVDLVKQHGMLNDTMVISFSSEALRRVKALEAGVQIGFLASRHAPDQGLATAVDLGASLLLYHRSQIDSSRVDAAHAKNIQCAIYTVDAPEELAQYIAMGIDAVGSNQPGDLIRHMGKKSS